MSAVEVDPDDHEDILAELFDGGEWDWQTSTKPPPPGTPLEYAAAFYTRMGLAIVPLVKKNPKVYGDDWWIRAITDPMEALQVFSDSRWTNIGWAQGYGTVAVDMDHAERATDELLEVAGRGAANHTRPGRYHRIFTTPDEWGGSTRGFPCRGWGEVRGCGGQVVIWGPHPDDPDVHYAFDTRQDIPPAPPELVEWLTPREAYEVAATDAELRTFIEEHAEALNRRMMASPIEKATEKVDAGASIHMTATSTAAWMFRDVRSGLYAGEHAVGALRAWWDQQWRRRAEAPGEDRTRPNAGEFEGVLRWALAQAMTEPDEAIAATRKKFGSPDIEVLPAAPTAQAADDRPNLPILPEEFWSARAVLADIRLAARSRLAGPDAVLGAVLARMAAATSHTVKTPPIISEVGLTYYVAPIGPPGSGKTVSAAVSRSILPTPAHVLEIPTPSGEGAVDVLFDYVDEEGSDGKTRKVKRQVRHNILIVVGEGTAMMEVGQRQGSTTLSVIRLAYTDDVLGNANAAIERRRIVPAGQYVYGLVVAFQPAKAGALLDDADAGTPQRFVWLAATDPTAPTVTPEWPDGLLLGPPEPNDLHPYRVDGAYTRHHLDIPGSVAGEIRSHRLEAVRGEVVIDPMEEHALLVQLKTAALLALLERRLAVTEEDWQLARVVTETSTAVRTYVQEAVASTHAVQEAAKVRQLVSREAASEGAAYDRALASARDSVAKRVARDSGAKKRDLRHAIAGRYRQLGVTVEDAIELAEREGLIRADGDGWAPGRRSAT